MTPTLNRQMISSRQQAYLKAMDIPVWALREPAVSYDGPSAAVVSPEAVSPAVPRQVTPPEAESAAEAATRASEKAPTLKLGPGGGGVLLVCEEDTDSASRLANDICRALGQAPVWAWPHEDSATMTLAAAVEENLYTTVAIFGEQLSARFFDGELPASLNSAKLVLLPSMQELHYQANARQALWESFCRSGMVAVTDPGHGHETG